MEGWSMLIVGVFEVDPSDRDAFITARHDTMRRSRGEPSCLEYTFAADPLEQGRVILYERWESQQALDTHLAALQEVPRPSSPAPKAVSIVVYEVAHERTLV
jgi:quinol monooxygenase YgiN